MNPDSDPKNTADPQRRRDGDSNLEGLLDFADLIENTVTFCQRVQGLVETASSLFSSPGQAANLGIRTSDEARRPGYVARQRAARKATENEFELLAKSKQLAAFIQELERMDIKLPPEAKVLLVFVVMASSSGVQVRVGP